MDGILLIAVLVITGGAVAFIGDIVGTKIGKKRLSIFGLRPRHTSMVITVLTGICITMLTFAAMAMASENVRTALFGMEQLNRNMRNTQASLEKVADELKTAEADKKRAGAALQASRAEMDKLAAQQKELEETVGSLEQESRRLEEQAADLSERNSSLTAQNDELAAQAVTLRDQNDALNDSNEKLTSENKTLGERNDSLREGLISMREGDIAFRAGEVIAGGVIPGGRSEEETAKDMAVLMQLAGRNVSERFGKNTGDQEIWIYPPDYEAALDRISQSSQDMIVRIVAAGNLLRGEPIRTDLDLHPNSIIFHKDEFIVARMYSLSGKSNDEAEQVVMDLLQAVNGVSIQKGILPDPLRGTVGAMEGTQFYEIVDTLSKTRGDVVLSAYARDNTDVLGPLRLNIKLEQAAE